jgi:hypothetical protein
MQSTHFGGRRGKGLTGARPPLQQKQGGGGSKSAGRRRGGWHRRSGRRAPESGATLGNDPRGMRGGGQEVWRLGRLGGTLARR